ncbi:alpha/beta hydrolase family protein [Kordiimonas sp.]|uniref:alpha/beta hydrolase family protein n=1 Tax=Kordiimonas sp. TaxID=1970157 RepID=UPI003A91942D
MSTVFLKYFNFAARAALITFVAVTGQSVKASNQPASVEVYASLPNLRSVKMSPNAMQIGYVSHHEGRKVLVLENIDGSDRVMIPPVEKADIVTFYWANDKRVLVVYEMSGSWRGISGQYSMTRLIGVDRDGGNPTWVVKNHTVTKKGTLAGKTDYPPAQFQHRIPDMLADDPDHILLSLDSDHDGAAEVRKINVDNGNYKIVRPDQRGVQHWYTDHTGEIRYGAGYIAGTSTRTSTLRDANGKWLALRKTDWADTYDFEGFSEDPNVVYVSGPSQYGTDGLYKLRLSSGDIVETVFEHQTYNVGGILEHPETGKPAGYFYTGEVSQIVYFDKTMQKVQAAINKALPDTSNFIYSKAKGAHTYLIFADSPTDPGAYYWLNFKTKEMKVLGSYMHGIDPAQSSPVKPVSIPVRDGSEIPAYLILPKQATTANNLPTVVLVHGGPQARDTADWNWWAQFLASRGYAVLQPNFRGSSGYGKAFEEAGENQWGGLMQDDVTDATHWAVTSGIADKDNICIVGASYGGYASLMGVINEPGLYTCAVSINGVTDLPRMKAEDKYGVIGGRDWIKTIGREGVSDTDVSPYHRAKDVSTPVLLMSSKDDARIDYEVSENMHKRLTGLGKDSRYVEIEDGGHNMDTAASRLTMLTELERFLADHIGQ